MPETIAQSVFKSFGVKAGPATKCDIERIYEKTQVKLPAAIVDFYIQQGWGEGFCSKTNPNTHYLILYSPDEICNSWSTDFPHNFIPIGSDGAGEFIVASSTGECGLLPMISSYKEDYHFVARSFDEFLGKAETGAWFVSSSQNP
ncbi:SMI1/KNR4 family protein [Profundibacter sp.]